jgi:putative transposase
LPPIIQPIILKTLGKWSAQGACYVSYQQRHAGEDHGILAARQALYTTAKKSHPARWSGKTRNLQPIGALTLNPQRDSVIAEHATTNLIQHLAA